MESIFTLLTLFPSKTTDTSISFYHRLTLHLGLLTQTSDE